MNDHCVRLSDLPDCVLTKILSLLKAREVTQTCILSKRWEKLWASVPCLNFNFSEFRTTPENLQSDIEHFKNFVSQFLHLREDSMPIERFKLKCDVMDSETRIRILSSTRMWIRDALNHKPKNLHVIIRSSHEKFHLPYCLVTCESLVEEYLDIQGTWYCDIQPDIVLLPKLRTLFFSCVTIKRDCMKKILAGCPALESLSLYHCDLNMRNITLWTLKSLTIINGDFGEESSRWYISAPNLEYLNIAEAVIFSSKLKDMSKVTKAKIFITDFNSHFDGYLLSTLSGVEDLELLNVDLKELLRGELPYCPTFHNLKNLTLGRCCVCCQFGPIPSFLIHCPNLEHLVLLHVSALCQICHDEEEEDLNVEEFERFEWKNLQLVEVEYEAPYHDLLPTWHHDVLLLERLLLHCTTNIEGVQITLTEEEELCFYPLILVA